MKNKISEMAIKREKRRTLLFYAFVPTWLVLYGIADSYAEFEGIDWLTLMLIEIGMIAIAAVLGWILTREGLLVPNPLSPMSAYPDEMEMSDSVLTFRWRGRRAHIVPQSRITQIKPHSLLRNEGVWLISCRSDRGKRLMLRIDRDIAEAVEAKRRTFSARGSTSEQG